MKHHVAPGLRIIMTTALFCLACGKLLAASEVSLDGAEFQAMTPPITVIQQKASNSVSIVESGILSDSAVKQTGFYNRTAILQFGNDKLAILRQPGQFNRALIVQVAQTEQDVQVADSRQGGRPDASNYLFTLQTQVDDPSPVARQFSELTFAEAKTVAINFNLAPELSRVKVGLLEDIGLHFASLLESRLDKGRFGICEDPSPNRLDGYDSAPPRGTQLDCSSAPFFATLSYGRAERDNQLGVLGYKQDIRSAMIGLQLPVNPMGRFGVAVGVSDNDADIHENLGSVSSTGYQVAGFGSILRSPYYLDLIATLGTVNFESARFSGTTKVRSDVDGWGYAGRLQGGYLFGDDGFRFGPLLAVGYAKGTVHAYWEKGSELLAQRIDRQERERFVASVGATLDRRATPMPLS